MTPGEGRHIRTQTIVLSLIAALVALMVAIGVWQLWQSYAATEEAVRARAQSSVQVVSANVEWVVETARQVLSRVDDIVADTEDAPPADAAAKLTASVLSIPGAPKVYVIDAAGQTVLTTDKDYKAVDITDREYFLKAKEGQALWVSSLMVSRQNGEQKFTVSRRMERSSRFAGVIVLSFTSSLLERVWASLALDAESTVGLIREDGWLVSRFPEPSGPLDLSQYVLFTDYLPKAAEGTYHAVSPADGVERMVAYQRVPGTNLVALASVAEGPVRDEFLRQMMVRLGIGLPVVAILFVIVAWIARLLRNDNRQRRALELAIEHNQMLLREVHHRVKNHLTGVVGLVNASRLSAEEKAELADRVSAMASLYASTYEHGDKFDSLNAADYIPRIVDNIARASGGGVEVVYALEPVELDGEKAMALALIVNEVVTNAFKYAFDGAPSGRLDIGLVAEGDTAKLTIADNGKGYDPTTVKLGTGSRLIRGFAAKLEGTQSVTVDGGTRFSLTFRPGPPALREQAAQ